MDMALLRQVAKDGLAPHAEKLSTLVAFCNDWGRETGDARYLLLGDLFGRIDNWWEEQGVPQELLTDVDVALKQGLADVLNEDVAADGSRLAAALAERVAPLLVPTGEWARRQTGPSAGR